MGRNKKSLKLAKPTDVDDTRSLRHYDFLGEVIDDREAQESLRASAKRVIDLQNGGLGLIGNTMIGADDDDWD